MPANFHQPCFHLFYTFPRIAGISSSTYLSLLWQTVIWKNLKHNAIHANAHTCIAQVAENCGFSNRRRLTDCLTRTPVVSCRAAGDVRPDRSIYASINQRRRRPQVNLVVWRTTIDVCGSLWVTVWQFLKYLEEMRVCTKLYFPIISLPANFETFVKRCQSYQNNFACF